MLLLLIAACAPDPIDTADASPDVDTDDDSGDTDAAELPDVEVVTLTTADDVELVGDYYGNADGAEAMLLLNMIPPTYDRSTWPLAFIDDLRADGYAVLALDRRGAGESGGDAPDAYTGPKGAKDANAGVALLTERGAESVVLIGASNGTTTCLDYAVKGDGPAPRAMIWMSPGAYTENNTALTNLELDSLLLAYPKSEAAWSEAVQSEVDGEGRWDYLEYNGVRHGTELFEGNDDVSGDLRDWLGKAQ